VPQWRRINGPVCADDNKKKNRGTEFALTIFGCAVAV
jgi:hypothetical protein